MRRNSAAGIMSAQIENMTHMASVILKLPWSMTRSSKGGGLNQSNNIQIKSKRNAIELYIFQQAHPLGRSCWPHSPSAGQQAAAQGRPRRRRASCRTCSPAAIRPRATPSRRRLRRDSSAAPVSSRTAAATLHRSRCWRRAAGRQPRRLLPGRRRQPPLQRCRAC